MFKVKVFSETEPYFVEQYGSCRWEQVLSLAEPVFSALCAGHPHESKAVRAHTVKVIYPTVALYRAMQEAGIPQSEALAFLDRTCSLRAEPKAAAMRSMLKIPGLYKKMPAIFKWVTVHQFGEAAGFQANFYDLGNGRCKFDMTRCLYCDVCRRENCPELTPCFCHTDDVTDGNMHPRLLWNRSKVMGEGADVCDFDLIVTEKPRLSDPSQEE